MTTASGEGVAATTGLDAGATRRVLAIILLLNVAVAAAKIVAGLLAQSLAVVSDGVHSSIDAVNNVVGIVLLRLASKEPDEGHPYGHGKIETLGAFSISGFLFITCWEIGRRAVARLAGGDAAAVDVTRATIAVMATTLVVNLFVVAYEKRAARRYGSDFLYADAVHTQSDVLVTLSVLAGLPLVAKGYVVLDALLALGVAVVIAWSGFRVLQRTVPVLVDAAAVDAETLRRLALELPDVADVRDIRSRLHGDRKFVELTLLVTASGLREAHDLTEVLERRIRERFGPTATTIHIEPARASASSEAVRDRRG